MDFQEEGDYPLVIGYLGNHFVGQEFVWLGGCTQNLLC